MSWTRITGSNISNTTKALIKNLSFSSTSSVLGIPFGTTAQRPSNPSLGAIRFNITKDSAEIYNTQTGSADWNGIGSETGVDAGDIIIRTNGTTITKNITIGPTANGDQKYTYGYLSGDITIANDITVNIESGAGLAIIDEEYPPYWLTTPTYPDPVTSGLLVHFDANKPGGYSGTTWTDHVGTFGNTNIQNRSTDWIFEVDSTTQLVCVYNNNNRVSNPGIDVPMSNFPKASGTIEMWLKPTDHTGGCGWFVNGDGNSFTNNNNWFWWGEWDNGNCFYHRQGSSSQGCCGNDNSGCVSWGTTVMPVNTWKHITLTWNTNSSPYESKIYVNGVLYQTKTLSTDISNATLTTTGQLFNGHSRSDNMQFKGYCSQYRIYNRPLSIEEIQQNFNTFKTRHGVTS